MYKLYDKLLKISIESPSTWMYLLKLLIEFLDVTQECVGCSLSR